MGFPPACQRHGRWAWLLVTVVVVLSACTGDHGGKGSTGTGDDGSGGDVAIADAGETSAGSFLGINGWMWFYTTADEIRFVDLTAMLDDLYQQGIRVIGIYAPYDGVVEKWLGVVSRDFYDVAPQVGTLADFTAMVDAAHSRGMKVVAYFGNLNIDRDSEFFRTAEQQYAAGDRTSREVSAFHWSDNDQAELPTPETGPSEWAYSSEAGAYYWSLWGEPGFDLDLPGARAEVVRLEKFWLDTGLDGFMFDAAIPDAKFRQVMVDLPATYTANDKWLTFEVTNAEAADTYVDFGLTSWFNLEDNDEENDYSLVVNGLIEADHLDEALAIAEEAHAQGKLTHAWSPWEPDAYPDPRMWAQEAALLAGAGVAYGAPSYTNFLAWPDRARADWQRVMATVADSAALAPSATRTRVPTGPDPKALAMISTAEDSSQTVLLAYNPTGEPSTLPVDLAGTGIPANQVPIDLYDQREAPPITGTTYQLELDAYGFAILEVQANQNAGQ
jgi:hypothetical protein